jgi:hypothetical protein
MDWKSVLGKHNLLLELLLRPVSGIAVAKIADALGPSGEDRSAHENDKPDDYKRNRVTVGGDP